MSSEVARHLMVDFTQMKTFAEDPLVLESGEGIRVTDDRGRTYIDGLSGVFTSNLGHGNPEITDALATQARSLAFGAPTMGTNTRAAELVEQLLRLVEIYVRLLRATIELEGPETVAAIITEPILLSAGVVVPADRYMRALREVCDEHNILLLFDEIITGFGRTGKWFAAEYSGVWPDSFCCGKGVTGGYSPLSIVFMTDRVAEPFWGEPGEQFFAGHTYGGNPIACAAGLTAIEYMQAYDVVGQAERTGVYLGTKLRNLAAANASIRLVRGRGMLQAIVFDADTFEPDPRRRIRLQVALEARHGGLLLRAAPWFVAIAPPQVATPADIDAIVDILGASLAAVG